MAIGLLMLHLFGATCVIGGAVLNIACGLLKQFFLCIIIIIGFIISFLSIDMIARKELIKIGQEIEHKQIIGYEDRIIFIAEEGGIVIPWYVHTNVENNSQTYTATVDINSGIYIHTPTKDNQRYYHSKQ